MSDLNLQLNEYSRMVEESAGDSLHNARPPNVEIQHEKPEHRLMVYMKVNGKSNREIAQELNKTDAWVSQIVRQKWFQRRVLAELKQRSDASVDEMLSLQAQDSLSTLIELRDGAKSEAVRADAAKNILDRFLGKPTQRTEVKKVDTKTRVEELEELDKKIADLDKQLNSSN